ncbi:MAG: hypothetical protein KGI53_09585 [Nitrospirota bacterium]|nr:hypothetical protein [Nitrospirota bacterium]
MHDEQNQTPDRSTDAQANQTPGPYEEGRRAGAHPLVVVFGVIFGLWLLMWLYIPSSKQKPMIGPEPTPAVVIEEPDAAPVMFKVKTTIPEINAVGIVVPPQATESQIVGLLKRLHSARLANQLSTMLPATSPGHKLGDHAIADIYIFSDAQYAKPAAIGVLARGAHAPGELYPQAVPFETAMEAVRGHYRIDLNDTGHPDQASLGFADESGVHSKTFRQLF